MRYESRTIHLPDSFLGSDRYFSWSYYGHGDISIASWQGKKDRNTGSTRNLVKFSIYHGSDLPVLATLAGYCSHLGMNPEEVAKMFVAATSGVVADDETRGRASESNLYTGASEMTIDRSLKGRNSPRFDVPELDLTSLAIPFSSVPGTIERVGGMGIYTKPHTVGKLVLVFALISSHYFQGPQLAETAGGKIIDTAEFCKDDIPYMARAICELSLGVYRQDVRTFIQNRFTTED